ncbi:unnamed protein product [Aphanomyces euteiches]
MSSTTTGSSTAKQKTVECDICIGMTMYTSAMRDARKKPSCIGLKSSKIEINQQGFEELVEKRQREGKDNVRDNQTLRLQHMEAFLASLTDKPQPNCDSTNQDLIYAPEKEPFRFIYWGVTLYSTPPSTLQGETKMVLPLCVGVSYLQRPKQPTTVQPVTPLPPVVDPITPNGVFQKAQAACLFTLHAMYKYADRLATNFPERYVESMERLVDNMHVQWGNMSKLAYRIVTLGGKKES